MLNVCLDLRNGHDNGKIYIHCECEFYFQTETVIYETEAYKGLQYSGCSPTNILPVLDLPKKAWLKWICKNYKTIFWRDLL